MPGQDEVVGISLVISLCGFVCHSLLLLNKLLIINCKIMYIHFYVIHVWHDYILLQHSNVSVFSVRATEPNISKPCSPAVPFNAGFAPGRVTSPPSFRKSAAAWAVMVEDHTLWHHMVSQDFWKSVYKTDFQSYPFIRQPEWEDRTPG